MRSILSLSILAFFVLLIWLFLQPGLRVNDVHAMSYGLGAVMGYLGPLVGFVVGAALRKK